MEEHGGLKILHGYIILIQQQYGMKGETILIKIEVERNQLDPISTFH